VGEVTTYPFKLLKMKIYTVYKNLICTSQTKQSASITKNIMLVLYLY